MLPIQDQNVQEEPLSRQDFLGLLGALSAATIASPSALAAKPNQLDAPTLAFVTSTRSSIELQLTAAGPSGTPGGFAIEWITTATLISNNGAWPSPGDRRLQTATFAAVAANSRYALSPGQSINVKIGDLLFDSGVSATHVYALKHSTEFQFRASALSKNPNNSAPGPNLNAATLFPPMECQFPPSCTSNLAYWTHNGPGQCSANSSPNLWPASLQLGNQTYDASQLCRILQRPGDEFGLNAMAKQLIAAKLNVLRGESTNFIAAAIGSADAIIGSRPLPAHGKDGFPTDQTFALVIALTNYNEGDTGPGSCC